MHTVFKEGANKGRKFWKCGNGEGSACKFWEWDDEAPRNYGTDAGDARTIDSPNNSTSGGGSDLCFKVRLITKQSQFIPK